MVRALRAVEPERSQLVGARVSTHLALGALSSNLGKTDRESVPPDRPFVRQLTCSALGHLGSDRIQTVQLVGPMLTT